jgi:hypothetical protein
MCSFKSVKKCDTKKLCRDLIPRVPRAISYDPINLDTAWFPSAIND